MNVSNKVWMWLYQKYGMIRTVQTFNSIKTNNCSCLAVMDDVLLNLWNNECEWWSMNARASKIWNE